MKRVALLAALVLLATLLVPSSASAETPSDGSEQLREAVTVEGIRVHQAAFQAVADANGGVRTSGTPGYDASAAYVIEQLTAAGFDVEQTSFTFDFFRVIGDPSFAQTAPTPTDYIDQTDFDVMSFSGSGAPTGEAVEAVDLSLVDRDASSSGCEAADFADFTAGNIALMQRGACSFAQKATNAEAAGAVGAIIFNQGNTPDREGLLFGTLGGPGSTIPVVGTTFAVGAGLAVDDAAASLDVTTESEERTTSNVIAQTKTGNPDNVVMLGAHLDSVAEGPGIQDNGTGSGAILEIALQLADEFGVNDAGDDSLVNAVRFGWWGAEESGLLGSIDYVNNLTQEELDQLAVYLNFDMIGSPNFVRFVYDGDGSDTPPEIFVPTQSATLEDVFLDYFASQGLATEATVLGQRSDHFAFCVSGVACGGLFTGAEGLKTAEQVAVYGGVEGEQYDQCYHQACDDFDNISLVALDQMSDAAAHATAVYAFTPLCDSLPATIAGSDRRDDITGTPGDDVIVTLGGRDTVNGRGGNDTICLGSGRDEASGGAGDDTIFGEGGADEIDGRAGADVIDGGAGADRIEGRGGDDTITGGAGADELTGGAGVDTISGGAGRDLIFGRGADDIIDGGAGRDEVFGGGGNDTVTGGAGADSLAGQAGDDTLDGGDGRDSLEGGAGFDTCLNGEILVGCETTFEGALATAATQLQLRVAAAAASTGLGHSHDVSQ